MDVKLLAWALGWGGTNVTISPPKIVTFDFSHHELGGLHMGAAQLWVAFGRVDFGSWTRGGYVPSGAKNMTKLRIGRSSGAYLPTLVAIARHRDGPADQVAVEPVSLCACDGE